MTPDPYEVLLARARQARDERDAESPFGFASRVVAHRSEPVAVSWDLLWARLAPRALAIGLAVCVLTAVLSYDVFASRHDDDWMADSDTMETVWSLL